LAADLQRYLRLDNLRWFSQRCSRRQMLYARCIRSDGFVYILCRCSARRHILGGCTPQQGAMTPKFELCRDLCAVHLPPSCVILCLLVRKLSCWRKTHPQTDSGENIQRSSLHYDVG